MSDSASETSEASTESEAPSLRDVLISSTIEASQNEFLPLRKMEDIMSREAVKAELDGYCPEMVDFFYNHARKTFAVIVLNGTPELIDSIYERRFDDAKFPLRKRHLKAAALEVLEKSSADMPDRKRREMRKRLEAGVDNFIRWQHRLTAPIFNPDIFKYTLDESTPLPFLTHGSASARGGFGDVQERWIHSDHLQIPKEYLLVSVTEHILPVDKSGGAGADLSKLKKDLTYRQVNGHGCFRVAQKQLRIPDHWGPEKLLEAADNEVKNLQRMNEYGHAHFIRGIAYYTQRGGHFFLFPWAEGGNLDHYWDTADPTLVSTHCWALGQMAGIASGIHELHQHNYRHGDLKPQNILWFRDGESAAVQRLVIADVGLAKVHEQLTQFRRGVTDTDAISVTYAPPEVQINVERDKPTSRLFDIWSIGCIFLEFVIWLAEGKEELDAFREGLRGGGLAPVPFWVGTGSPSRELRSWVKDSIDALKKNLPSSTPLRHVVELIESRLLVVEVRPYASKPQIPKMNEEGTSPTTPSVQFTPATMYFTEEGTKDPTYRAEAKEVDEEMTKILSVVNPKTYTLPRTGALKDQTALPSMERLTVEGPRRSSRSGGEMLKVGKPLVGRFEFITNSHMLTSNSPTRMYVEGPNELERGSYSVTPLGTDELSTGCKFAPHPRLVVPVDRC